MNGRDRTRLLARGALLLAAFPAFAGAPESPPPTAAEIGIVEVYLTPDQAVREIFPHAVGVDTVVAVLSEGEREVLRRRLGRAVPSDTVVVAKPRDANGNLLGYAVATEEIGKYRPFTFMVGLTPDLRVHEVEILVYRESRGGEVKKARFLHQYRGKSADDPLRVSRDILNIAGATLSVNALNHGVKRVLVTLELLEARRGL